MTDRKLVALTMDACVLIALLTAFCIYEAVKFFRAGEMVLALAI